jgi:hypothetical protein
LGRLNNCKGRGGGYPCEGQRGEIKKERQRKRQERERESAEERERQEDNQRRIFSCTYTILPQPKIYMQSKVKLCTMKHLRRGKNARINLKIFNSRSQQCEEKQFGLL